MEHSDIYLKKNPYSIERTKLFALFADKIVSCRNCVNEIPQATNVNKLSDPFPGAEVVEGKQAGNAIPKHIAAQTPLR